MNTNKHNSFSSNGYGYATRIGCVNLRFRGDPSSFNTQPKDDRRNEHRNRNRTTGTHRKNQKASDCSDICYFKRREYSIGAVLAEIIMVLFIVAMFTMLAMMNLTDVLNRNSFKGKADDLAKLFRMAATSAAETGRRYEIIIDFAQNSYTLREITTGLVAVEDIQEEEIIQTGQFNDRFQLSYVIFDDGEWTNAAPALFRVGKSGWQYGGKIVVADENGNLYSIVINGLSRMVDIVEGDVEILTAKSADEVGF